MYIPAKNNDLTHVHFSDKVVDFKDYIAARIEGGEIEEKINTCTWRHFFIPGGYAREMTIPKGLVVVGKIHKYECITILSKGHLLIASEEGPQNLIAPCAFTTKPGLQRIAISMEDTVITTFHVTNETDVDKVEDELTFNTREEFVAFQSEDRKLI